MTYHQNKLKVNLQCGHGIEVPKSKIEILQIYLSRYFYLILMIRQIWLLKVILCHVRKLYIKGCFKIYFLNRLPNLLIYSKYLGTWGDEIFLKKAKKNCVSQQFFVNLQYDQTHGSYGCDSKPSSKARVSILSVEDHSTTKVS